MKTITSLSVSDNTLHIEFEDGSGLHLEDTGQSCCESRYMTCDDNLDYYVGSEYIDWGVRNGPDEDGGYGVHEVQFLIVNTSRGSFTVANHNEHNGYYGGFNITSYDS